MQIGRVKTRVFDLLDKREVIKWNRKTEFRAIWAP